MKSLNAFLDLAESAYMGNVCVRQFSNPVSYAQSLAAMQAFTAARTAQTSDELWLLEHPSVYTYGVAGDLSHLLNNPHHIPVIHSDRGGQITWHGPGQLVGYLLFDLDRRYWHVRDLVTFCENKLIELLASFTITATARRDAPGIYVGEKKIASLGFKIKKNYCYHGFSLNINADLNAFSSINPCGYSELQMINLHDLLPQITPLSLADLRRIHQQIANLFTLGTME